MLCIPIIGPSFEEAKKQAHQAEKIADLLEFRLDLLQLDDTQIEALQSGISKPILLSHRKSTVIAEYQDVADNQPTQTDSQIIRSHHDFTETPKDLETLYRNLSSGDLVKIATLANSSLDSMRMLHCIRQHKNLIGLCMGKEGQFTRILGPVVGSPITFGSLGPDLATAPGQLTAKELIETYNFKKLDRNTKIFALLGDPVDHSQSHITHNRVMRELDLNAVFVKIRIQPGELGAFLELTKELPFEGFAVTKPLKEEVLQYIDHFDRDSKFVGAINTLRVKPDGIHGCNTDGIGTLDAIEKHGKVKGKHIVILGAGGAAKAIVCEAKLRGAELTILNRTEKKGVELAQHLECKAFALAQFPEVAQQGYDILVNATSASRDPGYNTVVDPELLLPGKIMMDVVNAEYETPFLIEAKKKGCATISGNEMFLAQAVPQFTFWFDEVDEKRVDSLLAKKA